MTVSYTHLHRGLFINDLLILESVAVHDQIAAGFDFQTVITAVFIKVMAYHQRPIRCINKIRLHDAVAVFPRGNKGFLGVGFDFSVIFPQSVGNEGISRSPIRICRVDVYKRQIWICVFVPL